MRWERFSNSPSIMNQFWIMPIWLTFTEIWVWIGNCIFSVDSYCFRPLRFSITSLFVEPKVQATPRNHLEKRRRGSRSHHLRGLIVWPSIWLSSTRGTITGYNFCWGVERCWAHGNPRLLHLPRSFQEYVQLHEVTEEFLGIIRHRCVISPENRT